MIWVNCHLREISSQGCLLSMIGAGARSSSLRKLAGKTRIKPVSQKAPTNKTTTASA
jgi:hypothetical protein